MFLLEWILLEIKIYPRGFGLVLIVHVVGFFCCIIFGLIDVIEVEGIEPDLNVDRLSRKILGLNTFMNHFVILLLNQSSWTLIALDLYLLILLLLLLFFLFLLLFFFLLYRRINIIFFFSDLRRRIGQILFREFNLELLLLSNLLGYKSISEAQGNLYLRR